MGLKYYTQMSFVFLISVLVSQALANVKVGDDFPDFELSVLGKKDTKVSEVVFKGRVTLVDFWANWCAPCKKALPFYDALQKEIEAKKDPSQHKFVVLGVNVDETPEAGLKFLKEHPVSFQHVFDPKHQLLSQVGTVAMPTSYLVGPDGQVISVKKGFKEKDQEKIKDEILKRLSKK